MLPAEASDSEGDEEFIPSDEEVAEEKSRKRSQVSALPERRIKRGRHNEENSTISVANEESVSISKIIGEDERKKVADVYEQMKKEAAASASAAAATAALPVSSSASVAASASSGEKPAAAEKPVSATSSMPGGKCATSSAGTPAVKPAAPKAKGGLDGLLSTLGQKKKQTVLDKSRQDWNQFKREEGIEDELRQNRQGGFLEKLAFLQRTDLRQFEIERDMRNRMRQQQQQQQQQQQNKPSS